MAKHTTQTAEEFMTSTNGQKRQHKATFAKDKRKGGYLIRVEGPMADRFAGREVPVTKKDNSETIEKLDGLIWSGADSETGKPCALYTFIPKPKQEELDLAF